MMRSLELIVSLMQKRYSLHFHVCKFPMKLHILAYFSCNRHISVARKPDVLEQNGLDFQNQRTKLAQNMYPLLSNILVEKNVDQCNSIKHQI